MFSKKVFCVASGSVIEWLMYKVATLEIQIGFIHTWVFDLHVNWSKGADKDPFEKPFKRIQPIRKVTITLTDRIRSTSHF